jgi:hypothetical protein
MRQLQFRGGLRVGWVNTSAPLVKLTVNHDELVIAGGLAGHFSFRPEDIIRLEPQTIFPVLGKRIKIIHRVPDYPEDIFFLTFRNPKNFIEDIRKTGFLTNINPVLTLEDERIIEQQKSAGGFPLKPLFALGLVILYHSGVLYYFISSGGNFRVEEMTHYFSIGGLLIIAVGIGLFVSEPLRQLAFRPGATMKEVRPVIYALVILGVLAALINGAAFSSLAAG